MIITTGKSGEGYQAASFPNAFQRPSTKTERQRMENIRKGR